MGRRARGGAGARAGNKVVPAESPRGAVRCARVICEEKVKSRSLCDPRRGPNRTPNRASLKRTRAALWIRAASVCFLFYAQNKQTEQTACGAAESGAERRREQSGHYRGRVSCGQTVHGVTRPGGTQSVNVRGLVPA